MTDLLTQHVAIVLQAQREGVTERNKLIEIAMQWHADAGQYHWTMKDCAKMVDIALVTIERTNQHERKS